MNISKSRTVIILFLLAAIVEESEAIFKKPTITRQGPSASPKPKLTPQYIKFLKECEKRMSEKCADEIFHYIFKTRSISQQCCSSLVYMGPDCHKALIERETALIKNSKKKKIISRSEDLWKKCQKTAPKSDDKNYPRLPAPVYRPGYRKFLKGCKKKMTEKCWAHEVVDAILIKRNKTINVDKDCCLKLLRVGKECQEELVKGFKNIGPRMQVKPKTQLILKNCKEITTGSN